MLYGAVDIVAICHLGELVRYADDLVIICKYQNQAEQEGFDFLGFHYYRLNQRIRANWSRTSGHRKRL